MLTHGTTAKIVGEFVDVIATLPQREYGKSCCHREYGKGDDIAMANSYDMTRCDGNRV